MTHATVEGTPSPLALSSSTAGDITAADHTTNQPDCSRRRAPALRRHRPLGLPASSLAAAGMFVKTTGYRS